MVLYHMHENYNIHNYCTTLLQNMYLLMGIYKFFTTYTSIYEYYNALPFLLLEQLKP